MLTLIHGDDTLSSRKILETEKENASSDELVQLDGTKISLTDILTASESRSLFSEKKTLVVENLLSRTKSREKEEILKYLVKNSPEITAILWEGKQLEKTVLSKFPPRSKIINCQFPQLMFKFLDSYGILPPDQLYSMFKSLRSTRDAEMIFSMLLRQIRNLIIAGDLGARGLTAMSPWQAKKFLSQSGYFSRDELIGAYRKLVGFDYSIKSGRTPFTLSELLDIYFLTS